MIQKTHCMTDGIVDIQSIDVVKMSSETYRDEMER